MKAWSAFYPDVLPALPGAGTQFVDHILRNSAIEFCERTKAHVIDLTDMDTVSAQMSYSLVLPDGLALVDIVSVWLSGEELTPTSPGGLVTKYGDWVNETGTPAEYVQQEFGTVMLVPAPETGVTGALSIKVAVSPSKEATGVYDWIFARWSAVIADGAKGQMMAMGNKPWSNPDLAAFHMGRFEKAVTETTPNVAGGMVRSRPRFSGRFC